MQWQIILRNPCGYKLYQTVPGNLGHKSHSSGKLIQSQHVDSYLFKWIITKSLSARHQHSARTMIKLKAQSTFSRKCSLVSKQVLSDDKVRQRCISYRLEKGLYCTFHSIIIIKCFAIYKSTTGQTLFLQPNPSTRTGPGTWETLNKYLLGKKKKNEWMMHLLNH